MAKKSVNEVGGTNLFTPSAENFWQIVFAELRFVATVTTGGRVKFVPAV